MFLNERNRTRNSVCAIERGRGGLGVVKFPCSLPFDLFGEGANRSFRVSANSVVIPWLMFRTSATISLSALANMISEPPWTTGGLGGVEVGLFGVGWAAANSGEWDEGSGAGEAPRS